MKWYKNFCPDCDGLQSRYSVSDREQQLQDYNFIPLSEYPGPRQDWKVMCQKCQKTLKSYQRYIEKKLSIDIKRIRKKFDI